MSCFNKVMLHTICIVTYQHSPILIIAQSDNFEGHTIHTYLENRFGSTFKPNKDLNFIIIVVSFPNYLAGPSFRSFALKDLKNGSAKYSKNILRSKNLFMRIKMKYV